MLPTVLHVVLNLVHVLPYIHAYIILNLDLVQLYHELYIFRAVPVVYIHALLH